jgi:hypothetical protein
VTRLERSLAARNARVATFAALLSWAGGVHAYCRTASCDDGAVGTRCEPPSDSDCGVPLAWPTSCVGYTFSSAAPNDVTLDTARQVAARAFATWSAVDCDDGPIALTANDLGPIDCETIAYSSDGPNTNLIVFRDEAWPYANTGALALTTVTYVLDTGDIRDADLELNGAVATFTTADDAVEVDLESILTHEAGHMLGLSHSPAEESTMRPDYPPRSIALRSLEADDSAGICAIYSAGRGTWCEPLPPGGLLETCDDEGVSEAPIEQHDDEGCSVATLPRHAHDVATPFAAIGLAAAALASVRRRSRRRVDT